MTADHVRAVDDWSGPGRALEEHLRLYRTTAANHRWLTQYADRPVPLSQFTANPDRRRWLRFAGDHESRGPGVDSQAQAAASYMLAEHTLVDRADTYYVSAPMGALVEQAAAHPDADTVLHDTDLPSPDGFVVLERPMWLIDHQAGEAYADVPLPIRAIGWRRTMVGIMEDDTDGRGGMSPYAVDTDGKVHDRTGADADGINAAPGIELYMYADGKSFRDHYLSEVALRDPTVQVDGDNVVPPGDRLGIIDLMGWATGQPIRPGVDPAVPQARRWMIALLRLMWQEVIVPEAAPVDRAARKRWDRAGRTLPEDGGVKVLQLRRARTRGSHVEADSDDVYRWRMRHRSITRGHWRRQWYRSLGAARLDDGSINPASHRLVWIAPFVRGPEDGPLVLSHNVTAVVR